jgi:hypothetical protein
MTAIPLVLSQNDLNELARQEANLAQQLGLGRNKKNAKMNQANSLLEYAISKGTILFLWECNPDGC